jgi:hypothetical protein
MSCQVKLPFSRSSYWTTWLDAVEYDIKNSDTVGQVVNFIPAMILCGFGRRQQFILALVSFEFSYFEGECYCFLGLGRQGTQTGFGLHMSTRSSWQLY